MQPLTSPVEMQLLRNCDEVPEVPKFHVHPTCQHVWRAWVPTGAKGAHAPPCPTASGPEKERDQPGHEQRWKCQPADPRQRAPGDAAFPLIHDKTSRSVYTGPSTAM